MDSHNTTNPPQNTTQTTTSNPPQPLPTQNDVFNTYTTVLTGRYCSAAMSHLFSQRSRHSTWRKLWLYLAEAEQELGITTITDEALQQMREHVVLTAEDFEVARVEEKKRRHDVMAHVHAFGVVAPKAAGIVHYGVSRWFFGFGFWFGGEGWGLDNSWVWQERDS